jgi:hypothetical protein
MNVYLKINDTYCTQCYKNSIEKNEQITSTDTTIELQNNYKLNVLSVTNTTCNVLIQNGNYVIIRKILLNTQTSILIPSNNSHILTLTCNG